MHYCYKIIEISFYYIYLPGGCTVFLNLMLSSRLAYLWKATGCRSPWSKGDPSTSWPVTSEVDSRLQEVLCKALIKLINQADQISSL